MAVPGWSLGVASLAIAVIFAVLMFASIISPNPADLSYSAVVIGVGTIVSVIMLAISLVYNKGR